MDTLDFQKLAAEVYENVKEDRKRMQEVYEAVKGVAGGDPLAAAGGAEIIARLQDCMTKSNAQLIELLKTKKISKGPEKGDREDLYDEMEGSQARFQ